LSRPWHSFSEVPTPEAAESYVGRRDVAEGVIDNEECSALLELSKYANLGDGYKGGDRPLSPREDFYGLIPTDAASWAMKQPENSQMRKQAVNMVRVLAQASERVKNSTQALLGSPKESLGIDYDYIHLVCREADDTQANKTKESREAPDSHPPHADNCYIAEDGNCVRSEPMMYWRTHSAILFLSDAESGGFEGGEFFYGHGDGGRHRTYVQPACGRMVTFTAGGENLHGVAAITRGRRCALAIWFAHSADARQASVLNETERILNKVAPKTTSKHEL